MDKPTKYINDQDLSEMIGMSRNWLQIMRIRGGGPPFFKIGASCRYDLAEVIRWLDKRKCQSTSDLAYTRARKTNYPLHSSNSSTQKI